MYRDYDSIKSFCAGHRRRFIIEKITGAWLLLITYLFISGIILSVAFSFFPWTLLPVLFDCVVAGTVIAAIFVLVAWIWFRPPSLNTVAQMLEQTLDKKHQYLSLALELGATEILSSPQLVQQVCTEANDSIPLYTKRIARPIHPRILLLCCLCGLIFGATVIVSTPRMLAWWHLPFELFQSPVASLYPGSLAIPKKSSVILQCIPEKTAYPSASLVMTSLSQYGNRSSTRLLRPDPGGNFSFETESLANSLVYSFVIGAKTFGPETITVVEPPLLYSLQITIRPPSYTGKKPIRLPEGQGAITAYEGSRAIFSIASLYPLKSASYIHESQDTIACAITDGKAGAEIALSRSGSYTFTLEDSLSQKNDSLPSFFISLLPDYGPNVRIIKPGVNKMLSPAQQETLWVEAIDDFGISELTLAWKKPTDDDSAVNERSILPRVKNSRLIRQQVAWDLNELSLYPGDTVYYWVHTRDNKPFGKPQREFSDTFFFRLPTFDEINERITQREDDASKAISSVQKKQEEMKQRIESLVKSARGKESLSWEEKKIVEDLGKAMQEQADSLDKAVEALQEAVQKMKESEVSGEILDKMDEVQKTLQELLQKYGDSLLFQPPKPEENMSWQDMQQAIEKMASMLPDLKERLDDALKYLDMLKKEGRRALLAQKARELAQQQQQIANSSESEQQRKRMEEELLKNTDDLLSEAQKSLTEENSPVGPKDVPSMQQTSQMQQSMQSQLSSGRMPQNGEMNRMSASLQSMSQELESTLSSVMAAKTMKDREMLLSMAQDVLAMSAWQEGLAESADMQKQKNLVAAEQQALRDALRAGMGKLDSLEMVPPQLLQAIKAQADQAGSAMENAMRSMHESHSASGLNIPGQSLNSLASTLLNSANSMQQGGSGGSGGGMMGGLRKLSAKQAAINSATSDLLRQMFGQGQQPGGKQPGEQGQLSQDGENARKAAQNAQQQLADQLSELGKKYGNNNSDQQLAKQVKELEQEARRIAQMMENPTPQIPDRQDRFLVRMLQTSLSMHQQDEGKEDRKSTSATTIFSTSAVEKFNGEYNKTDAFYELRLKALDGNFPESYRMNVQRYFDVLGEELLKKE